MRGVQQTWHVQEETQQTTVTATGNGQHHAQAAMPVQVRGRCALHSANLLPAFIVAIGPVAAMQHCFAAMLQVTANNGKNEICVI